MTPEEFLSAWKVHMERAFNQAEWCESAVTIFGDLNRAFAHARAEGIAQGRAQEKERALRAVDDEPELPGEMPLGMVASIDAVGLVETMRIVVRSTKAGISERIRATPTPSEPSWEDGASVEATITYGADGVNSVSMGGETISMPGGTPFVQLPKSEPAKEEHCQDCSGTGSYGGLGRELCVWCQGKGVRGGIRVFRGAARASKSQEPAPRKHVHWSQCFEDPSSCPLGRGTAKVCARCGGCDEYPIDCPDCAGGSR